MKSAILCVFLIAALYPSARAQTLNIIGSLQFTPQFSAFWNFAAPIRSELDTPGPISVFAPTNLAVQQFISALPAGFNDQAAIRNVLLYHVVFGYIMLENITQASPMLTLNNALLNVSLIGTSVAIDNYAVVLSQFPQVNGNIFTINKVLVPPGVNFVTMQVTSAQATMEETSAQAVSVPPTETSQVPTEATVPAPPPQQVGICTSQECCTSRAFPNFVTGDGFLEFNPICNNGGLHCDDNTGCLNCHDPAININNFNRPLCNVTTLEPYMICTNQACCTAKMSPNTMTGYGYLEFVQACTGGGENCFDETGCIDCFNPLPGTNNFLNRPVCSAEAIRSFGFVPQTAESVIVETAVSVSQQVVTAESTIVVDGSTAPARRSLLEVKSDASLVFPALFGMLVALLAIF